MVALLGIIGAGIVSAGIVQLRAAPHAHVRVYVIAASDTPGTIDARLDHISQLRVRPFDHYSSMTILLLDEVTTVADAPFEVRLPDGGSASVVVSDVEDSGEYSVSLQATREHGAPDEAMLDRARVGRGSRVFVGFSGPSGPLIVVIENDG